MQPRQKYNLDAHTHENAKPSVITMPLRAIISGYQQFISPVLGNNCRFHPSCSCYAKEALELHGLSKGLWLSIKRISKCHPLHSGGFDYVPKPNKLACDKSVASTIKQNK